MNMIDCKYDCIWTWLNMNTSIWIKVWISNNVLWLILHTRNEGKRSSAIWSVCEALITRALHNREGQNPEPRHHVGGEVPKDMDMRSFQVGVWIFNYSNINRASIISIGLEHDFRCAVPSRHDMFGHRCCLSMFRWSRPALLTIGCRSFMSIWSE